MSWTGSRRSAAIVAALLVISLLLYLVGDRLTPATSQARIEAFVVPVAAEAMVVGMISPMRGRAVKPAADRR